MRLNDTARVGLTVLVALGLLGGVNLWLSGALHPAHTRMWQIRFPNAQGIQPGAFVRVQGVEMGTVEKVQLAPDGKAQLGVRLRDTYELKPTDDIRIVINPVGFVQPFIEITPGGRSTPVASADGTFTGDSGFSQDQMLNRATVLMGNLNELTTRMNRITSTFESTLNDPKLRNNLSRTTENFAKASESGVVIAKNMEGATARATHLINSFEGTSRQLSSTLKKADTLFASFKDTASGSRELVAETRGVVRDTGELVRNTNETVKNAGGLVKDTRDLLNTNKDKLQEVVSTLNTSLKKLDATLTEAQSFIADPKLRGDLAATAANAREATETLKKVTADVHTLTGDPKVQEDLKVTVANLRDATEQAAELFRRVRGVVGGSRAAAKTVGERIASADLKADVVHGTTSNRTRVDFDATIPWSQNTFYRVGLFDFGENSRFNIQAGQGLREGVWARYGIHASKLGGGLDFGPRAHPYFSADLFGVDQPRVDLRANIPIASFLDLTVGADQVFNRPDPVIGIRYRK